MTLILTIARIHFQFTVNTPIKLPDWSGSMLRGAFGRALRQLSCMTRQKDCAHCPLLNTCPYPAIFAPPAFERRILRWIQHFPRPPAPYILEPEGWGARVLGKGEKLRFGMTLMGRAERELPLIVEAWKIALRRGLGQGSGTAELDEVSLLPLAPGDETALLYCPAQDKQIRKMPSQQLASPPPTTVNSLMLRFYTPLRLQDNGRALPPVKLTTAFLLMSIVRRVALLAEIYGNGTPDWNFEELAQKALTAVGEKALYWRDWTRYSSRQQCEMDLGGVIGTWRLTGDLSAFFPAIFLGQWLGLGKETVFGLGRYKLTRDVV
ncbi:MAG: CRISPR system precrRNA processing endoribonuclease RAMP protein Cas6 [Azoarcus sp.]|nr:CRISPR system precrRNA processing endoribonuclease RAMP protein Cas6 [Azoarcus sp.]